MIYLEYQIKRVMRMANTMDKYIDDAMTLLDVLRISYNSVQVEYHDNYVALREDKQTFEHFWKALQYDLFKTAFGWQVAKFDEYYFMIKKTSKHVIYIEVELKA
jgi:hypothetical protein